MNNNYNPATEEKPTGVGRFQALSVIASVVLPMLAAYIVFRTGIGMPEGTVNQGELLQPPRSIEHLPLLKPSGTRLDLLSESPRWRYLILPGGDCTAECEKLLYTTRQVHIRLGEKADRVERLLVSATPLSEERRAQLREQHPRLRFAVQESAALDGLLRDTNHPRLERVSTLLVDQRGFAMMVYDNHHSGNQLLKDIKRLLKYSYDK
ncbi:hypothetical protein [Microbulbifer rhizosphaerae]|uniref:Cytochrome oxidase Cu insertion factor, SCO1/SenC/PrrC family n=1 Tax=Microbulbifer rhizosphaerae TaxID=1562603 RepID=A0A7W4ZCR9_9GAMM|nr:hypothetical protein [Microbulbifer rhizosphaerae]MBB3063595.1 hypothetical protein [Microbulbifer rhizosphaerae]